MAGCPSTIEDSKRHRYRDENLRVQTGEESENVFVQKDNLEKKKKSSQVSTLGIAFGQLKVHFTTKFLTFKVFDRHLEIVLGAVGVEHRQFGGRRSYPTNIITRWNRLRNPPFSSSTVTTDQIQVTIIMAS